MCVDRPVDHSVWSIMFGDSVWVLFGHSVWINSVSSYVWTIICFFFWSFCFDRPVDYSQACLDDAIRKRFSREGGSGS
jgi:hypothetical protein